MKITFFLVETLPNSDLLCGEEGMEQITLRKFLFCQFHVLLLFIFLRLQLTLDTGCRAINRAASRPRFKNPIITKLFLTQFISYFCAELCFPSTHICSKSRIFLLVDCLTTFPRVTSCPPISPLRRVNRQTVEIVSTCGLLQQNHLISPLSQIFFHSFANTNFNKKTNCAG